MSIESGCLYIVATPIGNPGDISKRAIQVLSEVDIVYAEDTRRSARLFTDIGVSNRLVSMHEHNEDSRVARISEELAQGLAVAVISDAGTPLISDPGYRLVSQCLQNRVKVIPVAGPSALVAALSVSGLPTSSFTFVGFPPARAAARLQWFENLSTETRTLVLYESRHRIVDSMEAMVRAFGDARLATVARELTKTHETLLHGSLSELLAMIKQDENQQKGEFVVLIAGCDAGATDEQQEIDRVLRILLPDHSVSDAAQLCAELIGCRKKAAYAHALELTREMNGE